jgi:hypothetical protein
MAFIFSRAQAVVVWLGRSKLLRIDAFHSDKLEWLCQVEYWRQVWIVQEIGLARKISFIYEIGNKPEIEEWETVMEALARGISIEKRAQLPL